MSSGLHISINLGRVHPQQLKGLPNKNWFLNMDLTIVLQDLSKGNNQMHTYTYNRNDSQNSRLTLSLVSGSSGNYEARRSDNYNYRSNLSQYRRFVPQEINFDFHNSRPYDRTRRNDIYNPNARRYHQPIAQERCLCDSQNNDSFWGDDDYVPEHNPNRNIQISIQTSNQNCHKEERYFYLEDLTGGGDKDYDDLIMKSKGLNQQSHGVFQTSLDGQVDVDYLYDGGAYQGELAIFSLEGLEHLDKNSHEFKEQAIKRAKSNSEDGRVIVSDIKQDGSLQGGGGAQNYHFKPNDRVAMIFLGNSSFEKINGANDLPHETFFSTGSPDGFDHFKSSKEPLSLSQDRNHAIEQLKNTSKSAKGVLA